MSLLNPKQKTQVMIRKTFLFLDGIAQKKEKNIRSQGINHWDDFLEKDKVKGVGKQRKHYYDRKIREAKNNLYTFNSSYFTNILPKSEHWRLYDFFREDCCFLDIETSNINNGYITVVGLFDGINTKTMIRDVNLDFKLLKKELKKYKMLISFNGSVFDTHVLKDKHPDIVPDIPHFDLRHACKRVGLTGGLKQIEKQVGIIRKNSIIDKMYSGDPLRLWRMFRATGDKYYLNLLVEYNEEDIVNLKPIADKVYEKLKSELL